MRWHHQKCDLSALCHEGAKLKHRDDPYFSRESCSEQASTKNPKYTRRTRAHSEKVQAALYALLNASAGGYTLHSSMTLSHPLQPLRSHNENFQKELLAVNGYLSEHLVNHVIMRS